MPSGMREPRMVAIASPEANCSWRLWDICRSSMQSESEKPALRTLAISATSGAVMWRAFSSFMES